MKVHPMILSLLLILFVVVPLVPGTKDTDGNQVKAALVAIANGTDAIEAIVTIDVLRRSGIKTIVAGHACTHIVSSFGTLLQADVVLTEDITPCNDTKLFDAVIFPGGMEGAKSLKHWEGSGRILKRHESGDKVIGGLCAGAAVIAYHGIGEGKKITSGPQQKEWIEGLAKYTYSEERVVQDGKLITSRAPGTAFEFALGIVKELLGQEKVDEVKQPLLLKE